MVSSPKTLELILGASGVKGKNVTTIKKDGLNDYIQSIILNDQESNEPFYVLDLGVVESLFDTWTRHLPNVKPFYAVKCNPEPPLLGVVAALGANFDCASQAEIEAVLALGVSPERIVYANPCKAESHIKYSASVGVNLTTFDSFDEVEKIRKHHPNCELLIRIKEPEDANARCPLGAKYGALPDEIEPLLRAAQAANLTVCGVAFHIGSGDADSHAYRAAIEASRTVFDTASRLGLPKMRILNIGGGFTAGPLFGPAADAIKSAIREFFPDQSDMTAIAEPGRFFVESPFTLVACIIGKRIRGDLREYWINDGIYGSMNCMLYDHATVGATPFATVSNKADPTCRGEKMFCSTVFGPTCDALDTILTNYKLPELKINDWLVFKNMGAYTKAAGSRFNGFDISAIKTYLAYSNRS